MKYKLRDKNGVFELDLVKLDYHAIFNYLGFRENEKMAAVGICLLLAGSENDQTSHYTTISELERIAGKPLVRKLILKKILQPHSKCKEDHPQRPYKLNHIEINNLENKALMEEAFSLN